MQNKHVFRFFLNKDSIPTFLSWLGRPFHNFGVQTENSLSPHVFVVDVGVARSLRELDGNTRDDFLSCNSASETYPGHSPCRALRTRSKILKTTRYEIGSQ